MTRKNNLLCRFTAIFISLILTITCAFFCTPASHADTAYLNNPNGNYLGEAFNIAGGNLYNLPRSQWLKYIDKFSSSDYYLGTPFDNWLYSASPRGDKWQLSEGYSYGIINGGGSYDRGGLNSNGFIWHIVSKSLSEASGLDISVTGKWVPMLGGFNDQGFSRSSWQGKSSRWADFIDQYNVKYYEFNTKSEMLSSGVLEKGDIIWCVDGTVGTVMNGLHIPADNHHVGIYMGNGSEDIWWQTGPVKGNGDTSAQYNSINPIYGCAYYNTYVVLPWDGVRTNAHPDNQVVKHSTRNVTQGLKNPSGNYFNYGFTAASSGKTSMSLSQWQYFIDKYTSNNYYIGTPYSTWLYASCPRGDLWQFNEGWKNTIVQTDGSATEGGLNCMAFVWHALSNGLAVSNKQSFESVCKYVPFNDEFNTLFSRRSWSSGRGGWLGYLNTYNVRYYEFSTKAEMLASGALRKGDIIWCVDGSCGIGLNGLRQLSDNHHIGIYTGNGHSDQWWQSGPTLGDHNFNNQKNSVNPIYGCAYYNTYVVIPFADEIVSTPALTTTTTTTATTTTTTTTSAITTTTTTTSTTSTTTTTTTTTITTTTAAVATAQPTTICAVSLRPDAGEMICRKGVSPRNIIASAMQGDFVIDPSVLSFGENEVPQLEFIGDGKSFSCSVKLYYRNGLVAAPTVATVLKGDVNMDGQVDAIDASIVLACYTRLSVGKSWSFTNSNDELSERLAYLAADIDTESTNMCIGDGCQIDSSDASRILRYYAQASVSDDAEW